MRETTLESEREGEGEREQEHKGRRWHVDYISDPRQANLRTRATTATEMPTSKQPDSRAVIRSRPARSRSCPPNTARHHDRRFPRMHTACLWGFSRPAQESLCPDRSRRAARSCARRSSRPGCKLSADPVFFYLHFSKIPCNVGQFLGKKKRPANLRAIASSGRVCVLQASLACSSRLFFYVSCQAHDVVSLPPLRDVGLVTLPRPAFLPRLVRIMRLSLSTVYRTPHRPKLPLG